MQPMFRLVASIALVWLHASFALAAENNQPAASETAPTLDGAAQRGPENTYQTATNTVQGTANQRGVSEVSLKEQKPSSSNAQNAVVAEYPALALLALAIISIAALSRRDGLTTNDRR